MIMEITDYEELVGLNLVANIRDFRDKDLPLFYVYFYKMSVVGNSVLIGSFGDGSSVDEAIENYCKEISNKTIEEGFGGKRTLKVPTLIHTKLFNR